MLAIFNKASAKLFESTRFAIIPRLSPISSGIPVASVATTGFPASKNSRKDSFTITLPTASGIIGRMYHIKKTDSSANTVTIDENGAETIDGGVTAILTTQYESITIITNGSEWWIL